jgi:hypothetical protein
MRPPTSVCQIDNLDLMRRAAACAHSATKPADVPSAAHLPSRGRTIPRLISAARDGRALAVVVTTGVHLAILAWLLQAGHPAG